MNAENTRKLLERFKFFSPDNRHLGLAEQFPVGFFFECGDGWFQVVWDLCERIDAILRVHEEAATFARGSPFQIAQVKEKYGILRVYCDWETDDISAAIAGAEERSTRTCDVCGRPGVIRQRFWLRARCDAHDD